MQMPLKSSQVFLGSMFHRDFSFLKEILDDNKKIYFYVNNIISNNIPLQAIFCILTL